MKGGLAVFHELAHQIPDPSMDLTFVFYAREEQPLEHSGLGELIRERPELIVGDCAVLGEPTDGHIEAGCQGSLRFQIMLGGTRAHTARPCSAHHGAPSKPNCNSASSRAGSQVIAESGASSTSSLPAL